MTATASLSEASAPSRFALRMPRMSPLVMVLSALLIALVIPPAIFLVRVSLYEAAPDGSLQGFTLRFYKELWTGRFFLPSLYNSIVYAIGSALLAIVIGTAQALIVERTNAPGRKLVLFGAIISLGVPHVLYTVSWLLLLGRSGPLNQFLAWAISPDATLNVYSMWGMILIEGLGFVPLTFLLMSAILKSNDAAFEEAAMMAGASPMRSFMRITLPLAFPAFCALLLLIFVRAIESFEVPALVGLAGNINVITTTIYQNTSAKGVANYGQAGAYSVCLVIIVAALLLWQGKLSRQAHRFQTITGKGFRPRVISLGRGRWVASGVLFLLFFLVTLLPVSLLVFTSFQPFFEGVSMEAFRRSTLENYALLLEPGAFQDSIVNTLLLGIGTASLVVPFTALCAWLVARRAAGATMLDQVATLPLVFPAIILSVAFLELYVRSPIPLYGTLLSIVIASSMRFLPYGMRYAYAGALQVHSDLEEAATSAGAGRMRLFVRILLPLLSSSLISSWLLIFLMSVQTVSLPLLLVGPGSEIMAVTLFHLWENGQVNELAAMGVVWIGLMTAVSTIFHMLTRRWHLNS
ncbi:MAG: ABC transporter permease [Beijerinckiaceae bacterium]